VDKLNQPKKSALFTDKTLEKASYGLTKTLVWLIVGDMLTGSKIL
jgi:hypothetical protein